MSEEQAKQFLDQATQSLQSGQFQQALDLVDQAIALHETNSEAHILRGIALSQTGQPDAATDAFRRALMLSPHSAKAYYNLAVHYYSLGRKPEALEMAREAVRSDSQHAGAKDLVARIESEGQPSQDVVAPRLDDPLKPGEPQPISQAPTGMQGPGPVSPQQPMSPYQTPPGGYYRPGYETSGVHSLQFVANMGKTWDTIAWVLVVSLLAIFVVSLILNLGMYMEMFNNPEAFQRMGALGMGTTAAQLILSIVGILARLAALVWMIMELSDRRGNWLWLLPYILCCCCGVDWLVMGIYLLAGRQK